MANIVSAKSLVRQPISASFVNQPVKNPVMPLISQEEINRGATAYWLTNFYDENGILQQPVSANINIDYPNTSGTRSQTVIAMIAGSSLVPWTGELDTREMAVGTIYWSISTPGTIPVSVEDGSFQLIANPANQLTF
jgi:hypothetical protein